MEESKEKQNKRTASADPLKTYLDSTQEFFDMWMNSYQSTFGKLTQVPAFGPIREKQEKMMKGFPVYVNLYNTWVESNINFQTVFTEAMKKTYEKMIKETKGEITTEKYKDFYKIWLETYSETLKEFMKSGHFASDMGKLMTHFMDFQKYNKEMIEENILKPGNLPTKTDIDEITKDIYTLRRALKDLDKKTNEISKTIDDNINEKIERTRSDLGDLDDNINEKIDEISKRIDELSKKTDELSKKTDEQKIDIKLELDDNINEKIDEISKRIDELSKKTDELSKKTYEQKIDIKLELDKKITGLDLDKKITELDLDKKIAEISKKTKTEIQLDIDKKITEISKKTKTEIQTNLDNKISEISKKIDEQQQNQSPDNTRST